MEPDQPPQRRPYLRHNRGRAQVAARLRREYETSATVTAAVLAEQHDLALSTVKRLLVEAGTRMRPAGTARPALRAATAADLDAMANQWLSDHR